jgi:hypothetical protein
MKLTIECTCGNKVNIEGNAITDIDKNDFYCFVDDGNEYVVIECDKCNSQEMVRIELG